MLRRLAPGGEQPRILQLADENGEAKAVVDEIRRLTAPAGHASRAISPSSSAPTSSRGRSRRNCGAQGALRAGRRHVVLRPQGSPRRAGLPEAAASPPTGRNLAAADHQHAAARHRHQGRRSGCWSRPSARATPVWDIAMAGTPPTGMPVNVRGGRPASWCTFVQRSPASRGGLGRGQSLADVVRGLIDADRLPRRTRIGSTMIPTERLDAVGLRRGSRQRRGRLRTPHARTDRRWPAFLDERRLARPRIRRRQGKPAATATPWR